MSSSSAAASGIESSIGDERSPLRARNLVEQIRRVVAARPHEAAAIVRGSPVSWADLDGRSNAGAKLLHERFGPGPEPIAISGGPHSEELVAILAVLKSGRPFTWLDSTAPPSRLQQIIAMANAPATIADPSSATGELALTGELIDLSLFGDSRTPTGPEVPILPDDPANIVFTSGSTGVPKGVVTSHRYYLAHIAAYAERGFSSADRTGIVLPISFAFGAVVLFRTLGLGATLILNDGIVDHQLSLIPDWINNSDIEVLDLTPSLLRSLIRTMEPGTVLRSIRVLEIGGEPLYFRDVAEIRPHLTDGCRLRNVIGASEAGVFASHEVDWERTGQGGVVPVGVGTPGMELSLVDGDGRPVSPGETGEIWVTSASLASGYWQRPDLTATRYFDNGDGRTTYRTGDLGRTNPDGDLLHLGRSDKMVKIRSYLVEPAEIEAALLDTGLVDEVHVVAATDERGTVSVTAHVVGAPGVRSSPASIRRALRQRVPEHFIPSRLLMHSALPRNASNKVDAVALATGPTLEADFDAPATSWEKAVAEVWKVVLDLDSVGLQDDFFSAGGDSLAVEELISAMAQEFGMTVSYADLTENPTLSSFAERTRRSNVNRGIVVPLQEKGSEPPLFCMAGGGGPAGVFLLLSRHLGPDQPVYGLHAHGIEGGGMPDWSIERWASRCAGRIRAIRPHGPYNLVGHSLGSFVALEVAHQLRELGEEVSLLVLMDTMWPTTGKVAAIDTPGIAGDSCAPPPKPDHPVVRLTRLVRDVVAISVAGLRPRDRKTQIRLFFRHGQLIGRRYQPRTWDGPTVVYRAETPDPGYARFDWAPFLTGPWEEHLTPGSHNSMLGDPNVAHLAAHLADRLSNPPTRAVPRGTAGPART